MNAVLKSRLVRIGNSRGIRIPKVWLEQLQFGDEVEITMESNQMVIRPAHRVREGWDEAFRLMAERGDDKLLDEGSFTKWDEEEWTWP